MNRYLPGDILLSNDLYQTVTIMAIAEILIGKNYEDIVYIFEEGGYESCKSFDSAPYKRVAIKSFYVEKELPVHPITFNLQDKTIVKCIDQNHGFMPDMLKVPKKLLAHSPSPKMQVSDQKVIATMTDIPFTLEKLDKAEAELYNVYYGTDPLDTIWEALDVLRILITEKADVGDICNEDCVVPDHLHDSTVFGSIINERTNVDENTGSFTYEIDLPKKSFKTKFKKRLFGPS
jgi:hypothetical protein